MPKYLFAYHGGGMPETEEEQAEVMAAWGAWMGANEAAFADPGAPCAMAMTVGADGVSEGGGANPVTGYSLVSADDVEGAVAIASGCPIISGGGTVEVTQTIDM